MCVCATCIFFIRKKWELLCVKLADLPEKFIAVEKKVPQQCREISTSPLPRHTLPYSLQTVVILMAVHSLQKRHAQLDKVQHWNGSMPSLTSNYDYDPFFSGKLFVVALLTVFGDRLLLIVHCSQTK